MWRKVALYALFIAAVAAAVWWKEGAPTPETGNLVAALLLLPLFAVAIWLKRDRLADSFLQSWAVVS